MAAAFVLSPILCVLAASQGCVSKEAALSPTLRRLFSCRFAGDTSQRVTPPCEGREGPRVNYNWPTMGVTGQL